jgi:hypothetical protein
MQNLKVLKLALRGREKRSGCFVARKEVGLQGKLHFYRSRIPRSEIMPSASKSTSKPS